MLDIHTHLFWNSYDADRDAVLARAREAGVRQMISVGTSPEDNPQAIALSEQYADIYASVGLHPHFFNKIIEKELPISNFPFPNNDQVPISNVQNFISELKKLARHKKVVAIGECGLDYFVRGEAGLITDEQKVLQKKGFLLQFALARELGLPVIIHTRPSVGTMDAYENVFEILRDTQYMIRATILHCYQGDIEMTKKFLALPHIYFSFSGSTTYPVKKALIGTKDDSAEVVRLVPLERLFIETDCPFLAPQAKRGKRNEPAYVSFVAEMVCHIKGCSLAELDEALEKNWKNVFGSTL